MKERERTKRKEGVKIIILLNIRTCLGTILTEVRNFGTLMRKLPNHI